MIQRSEILKKKADDVLNLLACPMCYSGESLQIADAELTCPDCSAIYPMEAKSGVVSFLTNGVQSAGKASIQAWWKDLYKQLYEKQESSITRKEISQMLEELEEMFRARRHLAAVEMPLAQLSGLRVLEVGPGSGGHSALFSSKGADVIATDITSERAIGTQIKLDLTNSPGRAYHGDAENLPFRSDVFDIVYSNGVLHHSEDTERCISEVYRVLKPGGKAVLMLYARHSAAYWLNIVPRGLFSGEIFRRPEAEWIGRVTEGKPKFGDTRNPFTRVYSAAQIRFLLSAFDIVSLRKSSFQFDNFAVPRLTQIRHAVFALCGQKPHPGGQLVYGAPYMVECALENWLGMFIGFAWNIVAIKPISKETGASS